MSATWHIGDAREVLADLEPGSVDLVLSSPPFLALRSYLPPDDPNKPLEMGTEPNPAAFVDGMLEVVELCDRVLAPHGSLAFEFGDTYARRDGETTGGEFRDWPLEKSLCFVPQIFAASLAYGRNLLNGRATDPWRVRNVVRWCRPNPRVGSLGDKFRPATSELVVACKSPNRWFDLDAVRTPHKFPDMPHTVGRVAANRGDAGHPTKRIENNPAGAPPLDWWEIPTNAYRGAHHAVFPEALCVRPILTMCPERVCTSCGQPARRIKGDEWSDCGHGAWRRGVVLDPFAGSGTTLVVAVANGRDAMGIDLDTRNHALAAKRLGLYLDLEPRGSSAELGRRSGGVDERDMTVSDLIDTQRAYAKTEETAPPPCTDEATIQATDEIRSFQPDPSQGQVLEVSGA